VVSCRVTLREFAGIPFSCGGSDTTSYGHQPYMSRRKQIPKAIQTKVCTMARRRCCICWALCNHDSVKLGQIAHLDRDRSNSKLDNLAFLCLGHHDQYDGKTSQSKGFIDSEVKQYRDKLYKANRKKFSASQRFISVDGFRRRGTRIVTFKVAFPRTPDLLVSPVSEQPCTYTISGITTTGFTINFWSQQDKPLDGLSFNWMAYLGD